MVWPIGGALKVQQANSIDSSDSVVLA
jgi:hypothetical protein